MVEFLIAPKASPYCPLEVLFLFDDMGNDAIAPVPVLVNVEQQ